MSKLYTVVLNTAQGTVVGDIRNMSFYFDWSQIPDKRYLITFNFTTSLFTTSNVACLNILSDFSQMNTFLAGTPGQTTGSASVFRYLGTARYSGTGANNWLWADATFNAPTMINGRPMSNLFNVYLTNNDATNSLYTSTTLPSNYTLTMTLEELD